VKDHEKTKFYKEQVMQSRSVALDRLRGSLSGVKNNLHSLRAGLGNSMIELRQECEKSVMQMVPAILSVQRRKPEPISEDSLAVVRSENLQLKDVLRRRLDEFVEKDQLVAELDRAKNLAESRLRDLADVLHEMGAIKLVQDKLIQRESRVASAVNSAATSIVDDRSSYTRASEDHRSLGTRSLNSSMMEDEDEELVAYPPTDIQIIRD